MSNETLRDELLKALYAAHFDSDAETFNWQTWAASKGLNRNDVMNVYRELNADGLLKARAIGGWTDITPKGILVVEEVGLATLAVEAKQVVHPGHRGFTSERGMLAVEIVIVEPSRQGSTSLG